MLTTLALIDNALIKQLPLSFSSVSHLLFVGKEKAHSVVYDNEIIEEYELNPMPKNISSAVTEDDVLKELANFKKYFTPDAWTCVLQISMLPIPLNQILFS